MTTFAEMQAQVIVYTKRPELVSLTDSAIRMATLRAHQVDFFNRDQRNQLLNYTPPVGNELFTDIANIYTTIPLLRTPDFMQSEDSLTFQPTENLEHVLEYKDFYDQYNELRSSVFTMMGTTLRARFASATGRARLFYYQNPDVASATYSSWIADLHKEELAMWAAGIIWARSGMQELAQQVQRDYVVPFKELLVTSYLTRKV